MSISLSYKHMRVASVCGLTCDDGGGLASHLVLVHVLSIVQFPLHQNPGPESDGNISDQIFMLFDPQLSVEEVKN